MRCAACAEQITASLYTITHQRVSGATVTVNLCRQCMREMFTKVQLNILDSVLDRSGWVQEALPDPAA